MPECAYRHCSVFFEIDPRKPGRRQRYCCPEHASREKWERYDDKCYENKIRNTAKVKRARIYASLHCAKYRDCLDKIYKNGNSFKCHKCQEPDIVKNAYRMECYPSIGVDEFEEHKIWE